MGSSSRSWAHRESGPHGNPGDLTSCGLFLLRGRRRLGPHVVWTLGARQTGCPLGQEREGAMPARSAATFYAEIGDGTAASRRAGHGNCPGPPDQDRRDHGSRTPDRPRFGSAELHEQQRDPLVYQGGGRERPSSRVAEHIARSSPNPGRHGARAQGVGARRRRSLWVRRGLSITAGRSWRPELPDRLV